MFGSGLPIKAEYHMGGFTQTANTIIQALVPPAPPFSPALRGCFTRIMSLGYTSGSTQSTLTVMSPLGSTTMKTAGVAGGVAAFALTADPGVSMVGPNGAASQLADNTLAANDFLAFELPDGTYWLDKVASGTFAAVVMTTNIPTGGFAVGANVWWFGITTDKNPMTGVAHPVLKPLLSVRTNYTDPIVGAFGSFRPYEPILLNSDNPTAQCWIDGVDVAYTAR